jgi:hypothetical protein
VQVKSAHWVAVEADARALSATAVDLAGNEVDRFTIPR